MKTTLWKWVVILIFGFSAPLWWTWSISNLTYAIYVASGSPAKPTTWLLWYSIYAPSFLLGIVAGFAVFLLCKPQLIKGWLLFICTLAITTIVNGIILEAPIEQLRLTFATIGNLFFFAGTIIVPGASVFRQANA